MIVDHLIQYRISSWPKTAEKRDFCTGVTDQPTDGRTDVRMDRRTNGPTDRWTDRPSYRDAFLTLWNMCARLQTSSLTYERARSFLHGVRSCQYVPLHSSSHKLSNDMLESILLFIIAGNFVKSISAQVPWMKRKNCLHAREKFATAQA